MEYVKKPMRCLDDATDGAVPIPTSFGPGKNPLVRYRFEVQTTPEGRPLARADDVYLAAVAYGGAVDMKTRTVTIQLAEGGLLQQDFFGAVKFEMVVR